MAVDQALMQQCLDNNVMASIRDLKGQVKEEVIAVYLGHLTASPDAKIALIHPLYTANFYVLHENVLQKIKTDSTAYPAKDCLQGDPDFDVFWESTTRQAIAAGSTFASTTRIRRRIRTASLSLKTTTKPSSGTSLRPS